MLTEVSIDLYHTVLQSGCFACGHEGKTKADQQMADATGGDWQADCVDICDDKWKGLIEESAGEQILPINKAERCNQIIQSAMYSVVYQGLEESVDVMDFTESFVLDELSGACITEDEAARRRNSLSSDNTDGWPARRSVRSIKSDDP